MADIAMKQLLEAGVHFGHQTSRWNPKMKPYIFGARNGIHIIDLQQTVSMFKDMENAGAQFSGRGRAYSFCRHQEAGAGRIREEAERCGMFHVHNRWLGGTLTNFSTIRQSIERLRKLEEMENDPRIAEALTKKEMLGLKREKAKLEQSLGGIKAMRKLPDAIFVVDPKQEEIAVKEARKLGIPVVAVLDTNCDPDMVDTKSLETTMRFAPSGCFAPSIADAINEGKTAYEQSLVKERRAMKDRRRFGERMPPKAEAVAGA